jgi:predicted negative regulator of RcsB-dependent stress response
VELYQSEEEQIEALKKWWQSNGRAALAGIVIGISAIIGWNLWQAHKERQAQDASVLYEQMLDAVEQKQSERAEKLATRLTELYGSTPYGGYGDLFLAKLHVDAGDLAAARKDLQAAIAATDDDNLKHVARIRLIELMLANAEAEAALRTIEEIDPATTGQFEANYQELKGDGYLALNRPGEALAAYERAAALGNRSPFLQLKIQDLKTPPNPETDQ